MASDLRRGFPPRRDRGPARPKRLPVVLAPDEVEKLLACVRPFPQQVLLTTLYAAGLRLEEGTFLKVADIDSARMVLRVARGKGAKERLVPLSPRLLELFRTHSDPFVLFVSFVVRSEDSSLSVVG